MIRLNPKAKTYPPVKARESVFAFLKWYFLRNQPATYYLDGKLQCVSGSGRSFYDLLDLVNFYFPKTSKKKLAQTLNKLIHTTHSIKPFSPYQVPQNYTIVSHLFCTDIGKIIFQNGYDSEPDEFKENIPIDDVVKEFTTDNMTYAKLTKLCGNQE